VSDEASVAAAVAALPEPPALLVNNAGVVRFGPLLSLSAQDWRRAVDVNLTGTFLVGRAIAARMIEAGGGAIVNIASINGIAAAPNARRLHRLQGRGDQTDRAHGAGSGDRWACGSTPSPPV
jgi:NAD(P)-dependent dehydrogenase (short-subunit alcohol dehydrogenase family)